MLTFRFDSYRAGFSVLSRAGSCLPCRLACKVIPLRHAVRVLCAGPRFEIFLPLFPGRLRPTSSGPKAKSDIERLGPIRVFGGFLIYGPGTAEFRPFGALALWPMQIDLTV